jgi:hypothetical protein
MNLKLALATIHRDRQWWRKILVGGALMLTVVGYPWAAGLVMESLDNTRKGFPTPLPPWREWSLRYLIGLFAVLIDFLFFVLPLLVIGLLLICVGAALAIGSTAQPGWLAPAALAALLVYPLAVFAASISPVGRLLYVEAGRIEDALSLRTVRAALAPRARRVYLWARLQSLPAYLPALLLGAACYLAGWPLGIIPLWLALSALLYAHLVVVQLYAAAESDVKFG